jgi:DNA-binding NarL/FixJ family response regulator
MEKSPATIDIVIAEDHAMVRNGLRMMLQAEPGLRVVGEAADGEETVRLVPQLNPQVLVLDLSMPKLTGLEALRELSKLGLQTRAIILTAAIEKEQIIEALQLGAHGVVFKDAAIELLIKAIHCVNDGQYWIGHESIADLIQVLRQMNPAHPDSVARQGFGVTSREMEVIALVASGYTNKDLAHKLGITEHTAKRHLTNIFDKLGVSNRLELVLFAIDHRLINQD